MICLAVAKTRDPLVTMASAVRAAAGDEVGQAGHLPQINSLKNLEAKNIEAQGEEEDQFEEFVRLSGDGIVSRYYLFIHVLQIHQTKECLCSSLPFHDFLCKSTVTLGLGLSFRDSLV